MGNMPEPFNSLRYLIKLVETGRMSPGEITAESARRIREFDGICNSFISLNPDFSVPVEKTRKASDRPAKNLPLHGIPFAVKDLIFTDLLPTTCGSKAPVPEKLEDRAQGSAVSRLLEAGAVLAGKNNLHEYAFGITNENDHFGPVLNPWDADRVSGGSSGGSAAAVAAGMVPFAVGTDTRGSIRIPSSCCGVTGLKPTFGRVSISGVVPLSPSLDHVGPITGDVWGSELVFRVMCGEPFFPVPGDETRHPSADDFRLGFAEYYFSHVGREVAAAVQDAVDFFSKQGMEVREIILPGLEEVLTASDIVSRYEAYDFHRENLVKYPAGYGPSVFTRFSSGSVLSESDYLEARKIKEKAVKDFRRVFSEVDCLIAPTLPVTAAPLGTEFLETEGLKESITQGFVRFNAPQSMAGVPCLSLPCGFDSLGLPIGLQLISGWNREDVLFALGKLYQSETDWHLKLPFERKQPCVDRRSPDRHLI